MAKVPIRRGFVHVPRVFQQRDAAQPALDGYWSGISLTADVFGTSRFTEIQFADVLGTLGAQEVTHTKVDEDTVRHYLSMQYSHDDVVSRFLAPGIVIGTPTGFPFVAYKDSVAATTNLILAIRNIRVPPGGFIGVRAGGAIGGGARMTLRVIFVDLPIGEYIPGEVSA